MLGRKQKRRNQVSKLVSVLTYLNIEALLIVRRDHDTEAGPVPDVEEEPEVEQEEIIHETMFTFDSFEAVRLFVMK